jgi:hypothetical protein
MLEIKKYGDEKHKLKLFEKDMKVIVNRNVS